MRSTLLSLAAVLAAVILVSQPATAQFSSAIEGTIVDPSGAAVVEADVQIVSTEQGVTRTARTNSAGQFRVGQLAPGTYRVEVRKTGFRTYSMANVIVGTQETRNLATTLEIGDVSTAVNVEASAEAVNVSEANTSTVLAEQTVRDQPLVGRNIWSLVALAPGVMGVADQGGGRGGVLQRDNYDNEFGLSINAAGQRQESNVFTLDGTYITSSSRGGVVQLSPNPDTVQEIAVSANNFTAEKGRNSGATVDVTTKSGTNDWHGTLAWFHTNNRFQSRTVFQRSVPKFRRNEASVTAGGPVVKNKTFVFGSLTILRSGVGQTNNVIVETPQFRDFVRRTFPNSVAAKAMELAPPGEAPSTDFLTVAQVIARNPGIAPTTAFPSDLVAVGRAFVNATTPRDAEQWNVRVDHHFGNQKDRLYGQAYRTTASSLGMDTREALRLLVPNKTTFFKGHWTHMFQPTLLNEASFSFIRPEGENPSVPALAIPSISITGTSGFGGWGPGNFTTNTYEWRDFVSWIRGGHNMKFGYEQQYFREYGNQSGAANRPSFSFANILDFAQDRPLTQSGPRLNPQTRELAGLIIHHKIIYRAFFVQDDWKLHQRFTLNLGVRFDDHGRLANYVEEPNPPAFFHLGGGENLFTAIATGRSAGRENGSTKLSLNRLWMFTPRVGFAWDITGRGTTSIRGGYGIFPDRLPNLWYTEPLRNNLPYVFTPSFDVRQGSVLSYGMGTVEGLNSSWPIPQGVNPVFDPRGGIVGLRAGAGGFDQTVRLPYVHNWMFSLQQQLPLGLFGELNYSGSAGIRLPVRTDINRFNGDLLDGRLDRINPSFGGITYARSIGNSFGNFVSGVLNKRFSRGYSFRGVYTFGKVLDYYSTSNTGVGGTPIVDLWNIGSQRGRSDFDVRQRLVLESVWELPNPWKSSWVGQVFGNWRLGGIAIFQSGRPFTVYSGAPYPSGDYNADGNNYDLPDTPAFGNSIEARSRQEYLTGVFAPSAFPRPAAGRQGSLGRNTFENPGYANIDLNIIKQVRSPWWTPEGATWQLRGEFFNLLNRVNLGGVDGNLASLNFGRVTGTLPPRGVQLGLRIEY